ncbi:MAG: MmcQ/YjbR family DNA-binding protein [Halobacteriota archaeon]
MGPDEFRRIALMMKGAIEGAHMGHPDFRANGRIFATLYPDGESGMVKLTPNQQQEFMRAEPATFVPASGAWGRQGCTTVRVASVDEDTLGQAMTLAWQNTVKNPVAKVAKTRRSTKPIKPTRRR